MTKEKVTADMKYRLSKYILQVLLDEKLITAKKPYKQKLFCLISTIHTHVAWRRWTHGRANCRVGSSNR